MGITNKFLRGKKAKEYQYTGMNAFYEQEKITADKIKKRRNKLKKIAVAENYKVRK